MRPHLRYLSYVLRHKWHVFVACWALGVPLWQAITHDWQKFTPTEWFPYVAYFCGPKPIQRDKSGYYDASSVGGAFDRAWLHHQHYGPHHWQHWILRQDDGAIKALEMPVRYAREMVADWIGAGRALGKPDCEGWYDANAEKMVLHDSTRALVERVIGEAKLLRLIP